MLCYTLFVSFSHEYARINTASAQEYMAHDWAGEKDPQYAIRQHSTAELAHTHTHPCALPHAQGGKDFKWPREFQILYYVSSGLSHRCISMPESI